MKISKDSYKTVISVKSKEIEKIRLLYGTKKTMKSWAKESGADILLNGAFFNTNGIPIEQYKSGGKLYSESSWCRYGVGINKDGQIYFGDYRYDLIDFTSAFPMLVKNKKVNINFMPGGTLSSSRHPRSCIGIGNDTLMLVTVDGRAKNCPGMTIRELANYMQSLGAVHAANLDGGGSTHMVSDGKTVNTPCENRAVSNVVAVWLKSNNLHDKTEEKAMKIFIDPGHNNAGADTGVSCSGMREQDITVSVAQQLKKHLENAGYSVKMSRNTKNDSIGTDVASSIKTRCSVSNTWGADLFVSLHCNAGGGTGTEALVYKTSGCGADYAARCANAISKKLSLANRGVKARPDLGVLRGTSCPAMLIEMAFMDNAYDLSMLKDKQSDFALAIFEGITGLSAVTSEKILRYSYDDTVNNMITDGIITTENMQNWEMFLDGRVTPNPKYIRAVLDRYHKKI